MDDDRFGPGLVGQALGDLEACGDRPLTTREVEVAGLVAAGMSNGDIATRLFISKRTVESHVDNIKLKLGLRTRHQIIAWALHRIYSGVPHAVCVDCSW